MGENVKPLVCAEFLATKNRKLISRGAKFETISKGGKTRNWCQEWKYISLMVELERITLVPRARESMQLLLSVRLVMLTVIKRGKTYNPNAALENVLRVRHAGTCAKLA